MKDSNLIHILCTAGKIFYLYHASLYIDKFLLQLLAPGGIQDLVTRYLAQITIITTHLGPG